jgi:integrase/recombinase XerD
MTSVSISATSPTSFDDPGFWQSDPMAAFTAFVKSDAYIALSMKAPVGVEGGGIVLPLRDSSVKVYVSMFGAFLAWMKERQLSLLSVSHVDIQTFLERGRVVAGVFEPVLKSEIRIKYVRMLERVFTHLNVFPNPAKHTAFQLYSAKAGGRDKAKMFLSEAEQRAFMAALPEVAPFDAVVDDGNVWRDRRDRALLALLLGAGLKVSEAIHLTLEKIGVKDGDGSIPITVVSSGIGGSHITRLRPFAVEALVLWMAERTHLQIPGEIVFPANLHGGSLDPSTVYLLAKATFEKAGIDVQRKGPRTLRNSFAVRELEAPEGSVELVGELLGLKERKSTEKYLVSDGLKRQKRSQSVSKALAPRED